MKVIIFCGILLSIIAYPVRAALTPEDLDKIRLIVKEEIKAEIEPLEARLRKVEENVARLEGRMDSIEKQITHTTYVTYTLIALIVLAVGIPQMIIASRWRKDVELEKQVQTLVTEVATLKQQRIHTP